MDKEFLQKEGIDYEETFSPVARYSSIQTIISLATEMGWRVNQMDVKTAFLNGVIEEGVFIEQSEGFDVEDRETCMQVAESSLWAQAGTSSMVLEDRQLSTGDGILVE